MSNKTKMSADEVLAVMLEAAHKIDPLGNTGQLIQPNRDLGGRLDKARTVVDDLVAERDMFKADAEERKANEERLHQLNLSLLFERNALREITSVKMGVGYGPGQHFVYGDYDSIKKVQDIVVLCDEQAKRIAELEEVLELAVDGDGRVTYYSEEDEIGIRCCCGVIEYHAHEKDCWVQCAKELLSKNETSK